ncbi:MAG: PASTA domain-containing protein [Bacteroidota bacterium]
MLRYFISREFLFTLLGLLALGVIGYLLVFFVFLPMYTRHGESVLVPDVNKLPVEQAISELESAGLRAEQRDSVYQENLPPMTVVSQYPVPMSRVKPDRKVFLTIQKRTPPMVRLPNVENLSLYQAKTKLESWKLKVGQVITRPDFTDKNTVLEMSYKGKRIRTGKELPQGIGIDLIVSEGKRTTRLQIPNLMGLTYGEALDELRKLDLVGVAYYRPGGGAPGSEGRVYRQSPPPILGDSLQPGEAIDLFINGEEPVSNEGVEVEEATDKSVLGG